MADDYRQIAVALGERLGITFAPAGKEDLAVLRRHNFPERIVKFYEAFEPVEKWDPDFVPDELEPEYAPEISLHSIRGMLCMTTEMEPGACLAPYGFWVCASTYFGDGFLFDGRYEPPGEPKIVKASHEIFCGETTQEQIDKYIEPVAENFIEFLEKLAGGEIRP